MLYNTYFCDLSSTIYEDAVICEVNVSFLIATDFYGYFYGVVLVKLVYVLSFIFIRTLLIEDFMIALPCLAKENQ